MADFKINGKNVVTQSGVAEPVLASNVTIPAGRIDTAELADDAVTGAKIENNPTIAGNLTVAGLSTLTGNTIVSGTLTVEGTTTTIESVTITVDDKNIEMGSVDSPTDTTADGGGITLKGATDKTITWTNATDSWDFNQDIATSTTTKVKQKGAFMQSSTHQAMVLGG